MPPESLACWEVEEGVANSSLEQPSVCWSGKASWSPLCDQD